MARAVWTSGADILAVNSIDEAVALRVAKIKAPIIVLSYIEPVEFRRAIDFDITMTVYDFNRARHISQEAAKINKWAKIDLKIDTGMSRFGIPANNFIDEYERIMLLEHLKIVGIHSHFADTDDEAFSKEQLLRMQNILFIFQQNDVKTPMVHMAATSATIKYQEAHFDAVRIGLGLYGYCEAELESGDILKPCLKLKSVIAQIRRVGNGETIGYMRTFVAKRPMKIAVVPIGYAEGYSRSLSNKSQVLVDGKRAKVVSRICMNILIIDVTGIECDEGDEVILIGAQGDDMVSAEELANLAQTNIHEVLSRLSPSLQREYHFK